MMSPFVRYHHRRITIAAGFLALVVALTTVNSRAQTGVRGGLAASPPVEPRMTTQQMSLRADVIAIGRVSATQSEWNNDRTRILTHATIVVSEYLKSDGSSPTLTVTYPGGEVGSVGEIYSETATFKSDEEVMLFGRKDAEGNFRVMGGNQGKFSITTDRATGKKVVGESRSLDDLRSQVQSYLTTH